MNTLIPWILLIFFTLASATDLVAVYKQDVLLLRDVDKVSPDSLLDWESLVLSVPKPFSYPIGLTYDPDGRRLFVADAKQQDTKIFAVTLDDSYTVKYMEPVVRTSNTTVMEGLTYDPRTRQLFWTDSFNHGVYKTVLPEDKRGNLVPEPEPAHMFGNVIEPRGIAIDYCNELMYWSERDGSGNVPSSIEMCDLNGPSHTVLQQGDEDEVKIYYQGLTFDAINGKLLWAETIGDMFDKSYCRIVSYEFGQSVHEREVLVSMENCYPFSLTTDENYIYWADWGQQGIMRASRNNPNDVVKLVHAPQTDTEYGGHHGVYGLAILDGPTDDTIQEACKGRSYPKNKAVNDSETKPLATTPKVKIEDKLSSAQNDQPTKSTSSSSDTMEKPSTAEIKIEDKLSLAQNDQPAKTTSSNSDSMAKPISTEDKTSHEETQQPPKDASSHDDQKEMNVQRNHEINYVESSSNVEVLPADYTTEYMNTQSFLSDSNSCMESQLLLVVTVLAVCCVIFMSSTAFLLFKLRSQSSSGRCKEELPTIIPHKATNSHPRKPKRFGPKIKPSVNGQLTCSGARNDGVTINIEDCCQMTLCDTPCYTTVKKEGRGYKNNSLSNKTKSDDNTGLLDDTDDFTNC